MWNNAIGMYVVVFLFLKKEKQFFFRRGKSTHPGVVVDLCQNPDDPTRVQLLNISLNSL